LAREANNSYGGASENQMSKFKSVSGQKDNSSMRKRPRSPTHEEIMSKIKAR